MGVYLVNFLVYSMAMVGLLFICLMIYKKTMVTGKCTKDTNDLQIGNALNLNQRKVLYVIKAGNEKFLIAADTERTSFLAKLNSDDKISFSQENIGTEKIVSVDVDVVNDTPVPLRRKKVSNSKPVDYSEVMNSIKNAQASSKIGSKTTSTSKSDKPVMKEMLRKLSETSLMEEENYISKF